MFLGQEHMQKDISSLLEKGGRAIEVVRVTLASLEQHIIATPIL
jgi:hypothetical protein